MTLSLFCFHILLFLHFDFVLSEKNFELNPSFEGTWIGTPEYNILGHGISRISERQENADSKTSERRENASKKPSKRMLA